MIVFSVYFELFPLLQRELNDLKLINLFPSILKENLKTQLNTKFKSDHIYEILMMRKTF